MASLKLYASMRFNIQSTSNAIWWIKNPIKAQANAATLRKKSTAAGFRLDMTDLLHNISLQGYNKLLATELRLWEKLIWLLLHATTFITLLLVLSISWEQFIAQYFVTNLKDPLYPIENVPFPAVTICSNNRISLQAATHYAQQLQQNDPFPRTLDYYLQKIKHLSSFYIQYDKNYDIEDFVAFQSFLDAYGGLDNETFYNTRRIMTMLTPTCEQMILKCSVAGLDVPCFGKQTFKSSLTMYGPCCTFNTENSYKTRTYKNRFANSELGLTVVLNASTKDYLSPILNTNSFIVLIHNPDNYACVSSSNTREMYAPQNAETALAIRAQVVDTDQALKTFSPLRRKCYFPNEAPDQSHLLRNIYTFPNCITGCRMKSLIAICRCLPYFMPLELLQSLDGIVYCTLSHVACMQQYQFRWWNVLTERENIPGLEREIEEALYCPQCLPSCYDVLYSLSARILPIDNYLVITKAGTSNDTLPTKDISVLRVFFGEPSAHYYIRIMNNAWFEVFSTVGNILSIFMGFSMVAIFELLYFLFKYLFITIKSTVLHHRTQRNKKALQKLYICP